MNFVSLSGCTFGRLLLSKNRVLLFVDWSMASKQEVKPDEAPKPKRKEYYRVNTSVNKIEFDESTQSNELLHEFDPLGDLTAALMDTDMIQNSSIDSSFVVQEIVRYVGYIESNLKMPSSTCTFWSSSQDVEQCYFISFSPKSMYSSYLLTSFRCHIAARNNSLFCATLSIWNREKVTQGQEEIIWQSEQRDGMAKINKNSGKSDASVASNIVEFEVNTRLNTDTIYLMKIDVPRGTIVCGDLRNDWRQEGKGYLVHAKARYFKNRYYFRRSYSGKVYELAFTY